MENQMVQDVIDNIVWKQENNNRYSCKINMDGIKKENQVIIIEKIRDILIEKLQILSNKRGEIKVKFVNVCSNTVCDTLEITPTDYNGCECDWWGEYIYKGYRFELCGEAWYNKCEITLNTNL